MGSLHANCFLDKYVNLQNLVFNVYWPAGHKTDLLGKDYYKTGVQ